MLLEGKKIGFALTGSFCTLATVLPEMEKLVKEGAEIYAIMSYSVDLYDTRFGKAEYWKQRINEISGNPIIKTIVDAEPIGPKSFLDLILVAPCTGNSMAKIANAITDTPVTMAVKAHLRNMKPVVLSIATNDGLGANAKNLGVILNTKDIYVVPFEQDDPLKKTNSLVSKPALILPTILEALDGKQIQPMLIK